MNNWLHAATSALLCVTAGFAQADNLYKGAPRTFLFNPNQEVCFHDTTSYKKTGPYTIGFSNAGLGDSWRVVAQHVMQKSAAEHKDMIAHLLITDAGHDDSKQVADIQDLVSRGVDLLIVSANSEQAVDPAVSRVMQQGIPVVMVDRRIASDNFVTFVTASDAISGRLFAQWIVEKLHGKGNVIMLGGQAGSSPSEIRMKTAKEVFAQYPDIKILDTVYGDWSPVKAKQVMQSMIQKYGKDINAVWSAHGLMTPGSIEAFIDAGWKDGEIPPHTTADVNGPMQLALKHKVPLLEVGYPPTMYDEAIKTSLKILSGAPVPCITEINSQIAVTEGDNTPSIDTRLRIDELVVKDGAPDLIVTGGMGPDYNPSTYKIDYPK
jgi:ribose transport system substrate-binding protein